MSPFELGQQSAEADIAAGRLPSQDALDKAAVIIAASLSRQVAAGEQQAGAAA